jgi:hypothetical protein
MAQNPTHNPDEYSTQLLQNKIRPEITTYLGANFNDDRDRTPSEIPPLVLTALPDGGRVTYPHVVVREQDDAASTPDNSLKLSQHSFAVEVEIHGRTTTEMFNLRDTARGWFLRNRDSLRDAGWSDLEVGTGNPADWDPTSSTSTWQLTVSGTLFTHPDSTYTV